MAKRPSILVTLFGTKYPAETRFRGELYYFYVRVHKGTPSSVKKLAKDIGGKLIKRKYKVRLMVPWGMPKPPAEYGIYTSPKARYPEHK